MPLAIQTQILDKIGADLGALTEGLPVSDPYTVQFSAVDREPFRNPPRGRKALAAVYSVEQAKREIASQLTDVAMTVKVELLIYRESGDTSPSARIDAVMADVERRLKEDITLGGLAYSTRVIDSRGDIEGPYDNTMFAEMDVQVLFRHAQLDPRYQFPQLSSALGAVVEPTFALLIDKPSSGIPDELLMASLSVDEPSAGIGEDVAFGLSLDAPAGYLVTDVEFSLPGLAIDTPAAGIAEAASFGGLQLDSPASGVISDLPLTTVTVDTPAAGRPLAPSFAMALGSPSAGVAGDVGFATATDDPIPSTSADLSVGGLTIDTPPAASVSDLTQGLTLDAPAGGSAGDLTFALLVDEPITDGSTTADDVRFTVTLDRPAAGIAEAADYGLSLDTPAGGIADAPSLALQIDQPATGEADPISFATSLDSPAGSGQIDGVEFTLSLDTPVAGRATDLAVYTSLDEPAAGIAAPLTFALSLDEPDGTATATGEVDDLTLALSLDAPAAGTPESIDQGAELDTPAGGIASAVSFGMALEQPTGTTTATGEAEAVTFDTAFDTPAGGIADPLDFASSIDTPAAGTPDAVDLALTLDNPAGTVTATGEAEEVFFATSIDQPAASRTADLLLSTSVDAVAAGIADEVGMALTLEQPTGSLPGGSEELYEILENGVGVYDITYAFENGGLWQNTAGTTAVTAVGQDVYRIDDQSGNGAHIEITTSGTAVTLQQNATTGAYYLAWHPNAEGAQTNYTLSGTTYYFVAALGAMSNNGVLFGSTGSNQINIARTQDGNTGASMRRLSGSEQTYVDGSAVGATTGEPTRDELHDAMDPTLSGNDGHVLSVRDFGFDAALTAGGLRVVLDANGAHLYAFALALSETAQNITDAEAHCATLNDAP